ncbi:peptidoglycan-binding protein [Acetobacteraceae bacterium KSS8]|uniref:Peptidoglycan-binding protein n=1 Tax=Endosaccharibacter trunci TaxID=2812733 RepID=A0ABT1W6Z6_9PROT|nr:peptidoglycan-binding protein [Acetobacteraceae bacterium KSS8]
MSSFRALPGVSAALGLLLSAGTALAAPDASGANASGKGAFLLIDGGAPAGQPRLAGCSRAMSDLHTALDKAGAANTLLLAPTASALREALLRFGNTNGTGANAVLFCGYAAETGGNVFALGSDFAPHDDPALSAVSIRAFSRVSGDKNGLVVLDLHPVAAEGASVAAVAGALNGAAGAWSTDPSLSGTRIVETDTAPGDASLTLRAAQSGATSPETLARALSAPRPAETASAQATLPAAGPVTAAAPAPTTAPSAAPEAAQQAGTDKAPATPAADSGKPSGDGGTKTEDATATQTGADHPDASKTAGDAGAVPLAPKPAPRPRVHVDPAVRRIQVALLARGLFSGRVNGVNGAETQRGIKHFQAMLGHPVTGELTADETKQLTGG